MPQSIRNRSAIVRVAGATLFAIVLWGIVSLSDQFDTTLDVPLGVDPPPNHALTEPIPSSLKVRIRATGWNLLKMLAAGRVECVLRPTIRTNGTEVAVGFGRRDLLASIRTNITDAQQLNVFPDSVTLVLGPVDTRKVPLRPEVVINTRRGFQVVGGVRITPDSILLIGSKKVLQDIASWPTAPLVLDDVHRPIARAVPVSDTLGNIITPVVRRAELYADVQEVAERVIPDVPIVNRGTITDTNFRLVLQPQRVEVLLRGGARDLSRIDPSAIRAYVQIVEGADTLGLAYPHVLLPQGFNLNVVSIKPARVRYVFRRGEG
jgi:hypothetical protein